MSSAIDYYRAYIAARGFPASRDDAGLSLPEKVAFAVVMLSAGLIVGTAITMAVGSLAWTQLGVDLLAAGHLWAVRVSISAITGSLSALFVGAPLADWLFNVPIGRIDGVTVDG